MSRIISDNITSPLGLTTQENYRALLSGETRLSSYERWGLPESFTASLMSDDQWQQIQEPDRTRLETFMLYSIREAVSRTDIELSSDRTCLIISTTKGNIELIDEAPSQASPAVAAQHIAETLGIKTMPIVVCNACISGVSALILADRLLKTGAYDTAIVCGADVLGKFIVSGFQSLKAVSQDPCRPFDIERLGLNLGEAAATIVLSNDNNAGGAWRIDNGAVRNDAFHITNPSPQGIGSSKAMLSALSGSNAEDLAVVNLHGTATMYNDQMESKAVQAAGLSAIPANAIKGYYGHTMGAAGLLETIVTMHSVDNGIILGTRGFEEIGVSGKVNISAESKTTDKTSFLKVISGFGGCNGAVKCSKGNTETEETITPELSLKTTHTISITPENISLDGRAIAAEGTGKALIKDAYKRYIGNYPRFYKMDALSRLGFVASELLLQAEGDNNNNSADETGHCQGDTTERFREREDRAVILFNRSSSLQADLEYNKSIADTEDFFPSPAAFVYTLPNIVTGEIALHNKYNGETTFYLLPEKDEAMMEKVIASTFTDTTTHSILAGWIEVEDEDHFETTLRIISNRNK